MQDKGICHLFQPKFGIEVRAAMVRGAAKGIGDSRRNIQEVEAELFLLRQSLFKVRHHNTDQAEDIVMDSLDLLPEVLVDTMDILSHMVDILTDSTE